MDKDEPFNDNIKGLDNSFKPASNFNPDNSLYEMNKSTQEVGGKKNKRTKKNKKSKKNKRTKKNRKHNKTK